MLVVHYLGLVVEYLSLVVEYLELNHRYYICRTTSERAF
jgi:hypothetical protein